MLRRDRFGGEGRSTSFIPAVPAAWSVTTIAFMIIFSSDICLFAEMLQHWNVRSTSHGRAGPAINSTIAGHAPIAFGSPAATVTQVTSGKLRALAVASKSDCKPSRTWRRSVFLRVKCDVWVGPLVPAKTPKEIVALLNRQINEIVVLQDMVERLTSLGFRALPSSTEEHAARIKTESAKCAMVIPAAGIKPQ